MNPLLSIIVPVYNVCDFLEQCIESILKQTFTDFELIIVDDGSTDGSSELCDIMQKKDSRIKVIHQTNGGVVSARKSGLLAAKGKYAGYVDGDDWIDSQMYEKMVHYMQKYGCDLVMCDFVHENKPAYFSSDEINITLDGGYYDEQAIKEKILPTMIYSGEFYKFGIHPVIWNKLYNREKLIKHQMAVDNKIKTGEDAACVYPYMLDTTGFYFIKNAQFYHYRHSINQMTVAFDNLHFERFKALYDFFSDSEIASSPYCGQLDYYYSYMTKTVIGNELKSANKITFREKLKHIREISEFACKKGFICNLKINSFMYKLYFGLIKYNKPFLLSLGTYITRLKQKIFR